MNYLFPLIKGKCACGCGNLLTGRKRKWFSKQCMLTSLHQFYIIKGDNSAIRENLYSIESGFCRECGVFDSKWQADHILPVCKGGGACGIDNFQTLCVDCHKSKTSNLYGVPHVVYVHTSSGNVFPPSYHTCRTINEGVGKDIIRYAMVGS